MEKNNRRNKTGSPLKGFERAVKGDSEKLKRLNDMRRLGEEYLNLQFSYSMDILFNEKVKCKPLSEFDPSKINFKYPEEVAIFNNYVTIGRNYNDMVNATSLATESLNHAFYMFLTLYTAVYLNKKNIPLPPQFPKGDIPRAEIWKKNYIELTYQSIRGYFVYRTGLEVLSDVFSSPEVRLEGAVVRKEHILSLLHDINIFLKKSLPKESLPRLYKPSDFTIKKGKKDTLRKALSGIDLVRPINIDIMAYTINALWEDL